MQKAKVFWDYFMATGNIGAYLIFCEIQRQKVKVLKIRTDSHFLHEVDG
ncbi:MAG TPA: YqzL family protein [Clostridia bacterium]|jgi:hypothetical protein|nr:YqzL family protein [Clostridia bacterium]